MEDKDKSRRGFLKYLLGLPFGVTAVKKLYGHTEKQRKFLLNVFSVAGYQFYDGEVIRN